LLFELSIDSFGKPRTSTSGQGDARVPSESTALFFMDGSGNFAGFTGAPALMLKISAKQTAKTTTKTV
jgi:hypothetical protein